MQNMVLGKNPPGPKPNPNLTLYGGGGGGFLGFSFLTPQNITHGVLSFVQLTKYKFFKTENLNK